MGLNHFLAGTLSWYFAGRARSAPAAARPPLIFQSMLFAEAMNLNPESGEALYHLLSGLEDRFPATADRLLTSPPDGPVPRSTLPDSIRTTKWQTGKLIAFNRAETAILRINGLIGFGFPVDEYVEAIRHASTVQIHINSGGGYAPLAATLCRELRGKRVEVIITKAQSAGAVLAQAGTRRKMLANGSMMVHGAVGFMFGTPGQLRNEANSVESLNQELESMFHRSDPALVDKWFAGEDYYFTAEEAVAVGLADEVIQPEALPNLPAIGPEPTPAQPESDDRIVEELGRELLCRLRRHFKDPARFRAMIQKTVEANL